MILKCAQNMDKSATAICYIQLVYYSISDYIMKIYIMKDYIMKISNMLSMNFAHSMVD